jgi:hypothetical protein
MTGIVSHTLTMPHSANRHLHLFAVLACLVLILSVDILGLIGVADSKASGAFELPASTIAAWNGLDADGREMLDKEHEAIVAEIRLRIEQEHLLFALKFGLVGAILWAFLQTAFRPEHAGFEYTPFAALAAWAAVVAASIVDLRVMSNQSFLVTLGGWSRQYEELTLGSSRAQLGWEAFLADNLLSKSVYPALRVNGQILTALLFCVTAFVFLARADGKSDPNIARISSACGILSICLMTIASLSLRHASFAAVIYLVAGFLGILLVAILARWSRRNYQQSGAASS